MSGFILLSLLGDVFKYAFGSLLLGLVLGIGIVFLLFFLIRGIYPLKTFSPLSTLAGAVLTLLIVPEMITFCGAVGLKMKCGDICEWLDDEIVHPEQYASPAYVSEVDSQEIVQQLIHRYPIVDSFVGSGTFTNFTTANISKGISDELSSFLNSYIWKSLGYSLLYLVVTAIIVILTMRGQNAMGRRRPLDRRSTHPVTRRGSRPLRSGAARY